MATTIVLVWGNGANPERAFFQKTPDAEGWWRELALRDFRKHPEAFWTKAFILPLAVAEAIRRVSPEVQKDLSVEGWRVFCGDVVNQEPPPSCVTQDGLWVVNGLTLPADYAPFVKRSEHAPDWHFKGQADAYGRPCGAQFFPYRTLEQTVGETLGLTEFFSPGYTRLYTPQAEEQDWVRCEAERPGFLPDIADFSKIVWFGRTPAGEPVCFDFRESTQEPSIIYCPDMYCHWRRVAPNFHAFVALLEPAW
jgi:SMI1/KNR4 family protein SUKH-1